MKPTPDAMQYLQTQLTMKLFTCLLLLISISAACELFDRANVSVTTSAHPLVPYCFIRDTAGRYTGAPKVKNPLSAVEFAAK